MPNSRADEYLRKAEECRAQAGRAKLDGAREGWLSWRRSGSVWLRKPTPPSEYHRMRSREVLDALVERADAAILRNRNLRRERLKLVSRSERAGAELARVTLEVAIVTAQSISRGPVERGDALNFLRVADPRGLL